MGSEINRFYSEKISQNRFHGLLAGGSDFEENPEKLFLGSFIPSKVRGELK